MHLAYLDFPSPEPVTILGLIVTIVWIYQFSFLMGLDYRSFPGHFDKLIWAAAFIAAPFVHGIGIIVPPIAFILWRRSMMNKDAGDLLKKDPK